MDKTRRDLIIGSAGFGAFPSIVLGQPFQQQGAELPRPVPDGKDRNGETLKIGTTELLRKVSGADSQGNLVVYEEIQTTRGGIPLHGHPHQDEWWYVIDGELLFQVGIEKFKLRTGESVLGPRGIPHTFVNSSGGSTKMIIAFTPAGKIEPFFEVMSQERPRTPAAFQALLLKYDMEVVGPPLN